MERRTFLHNAAVARAPDAHPDDDLLELLDRVQRRVLWLAVRMVDAANRERPNAEGVKVGGHQASSASMVSLMTALWFAHLGADDRVAVKPHASPVLHAIQYLLGELDGRYLTTLRARGGLQAYPSRTKDPDRIDFSTGSVGLGAVAPLFGAVTRRYVDAHFGPRPRSRFIALLGDAELDEGNVWEALVDPVTQGVGEALWVVDLNRQSLDRVIPGVKAAILKRLFETNGWHVLDVKYGRLLEKAFARDGGEQLRLRLDEMSNEEYQALFASHGQELRERVVAGRAGLGRFLSDYSDDELAPLVQNLAGHDLGALLEGYRAADAVSDRPTVMFAYTIKGWGLPIAGDPLNHSAMLTPAQIDELRRSVGLEPATEWDRFAEGTAGAELCASVASRLRREPAEAADPPSPPPASGARLTAAAKPTSTQEAFGRVLTALAQHPDLARRLVTTSPDVSVSTNLGGWINKMGVFSFEQRPDWQASDRLLRWVENPSGHHIELGISEMNLFLLLGQLGLAHDLSGERLLPIGTLYDPFVCRGLDAFIYACYSDARFVVVGTPSGVTLAPEGGAHQSTITASIGLELPGVSFAEPAYALALDWLLCDGLDRLSRPASEGGGSLYLRLTTRPIDQAPFDAALARIGEEQLRANVLAGGYRLVEPSTGAAGVVLAASGAVMPEALAAAGELEDEGVATAVVDVTSLDRLYRGWRATVVPALRTARTPAAGHLHRLIPEADRAAVIVTVHDASSHAMAWLGAPFGQRVVSLGVDEFGQSGTVHDLYEIHGLTQGAILNAALVALG